MRGNIYRSVLLLLLGVFWLPASAETREIQPLSSIKEAVRSFLEQEAQSMQGEVEVSVGRIDSRLRLRRCDRPLSTSWPQGGRKTGNVSVGVSCEGEISWSIFVRGKLAVFDSVVVASRHLGRGSILHRGDVELRREEMSRLGGGYYSHVEELFGMEVRRSVRAGMVLNRSLVKAPVVVKRGELVTIEAKTDAISVRMEGKALGAGARGELIPVENLSSGQKIEAEVMSPGIVRVRM